MTERNAPLSAMIRFAAAIAAAGLLFTASAIAQTRLPPPTAPVQADARQDRIEELETQLREAEARNEQLQRQLMEAQREITRLNGIVGELAGVNQSLSTPPPEGADGAAPLTGGTARPGGSAEVAPSTLNQAQRAATGTLGSIPADAAPAAPVMDAADVYSRARELLVNGEYAEAEAAFGDFLERYPNADTAADARFWFAFTLLARNNYQDAASHFVTYLQNTPQGPRAPEAQVRPWLAAGRHGNVTPGAGRAFASA